MISQGVELVMQGHGIWRMLYQGLDTPLTRLGSIIDHSNRQVVAGAESEDQDLDVEGSENTDGESGSMESEEVTEATTAGNTGNKTNLLKFDAKTFLSGMIQHLSRLTVLFHVP